LKGEEWRPSLRFVDAGRGRDEHFLPEFEGERKAVLRYEKKEKETYLLIIFST